MYRLGISQEIYIQNQTQNTFMGLLCQVSFSSWSPWYFLIPWDHFSVSGPKSHSAMPFHDFAYILAKQRTRRKKAMGVEPRLWEWRHHWMQRKIPPSHSFGSCKLMWCYGHHKVAGGWSTEKGRKGEEKKGEKRGQERKGKGGERKGKDQRKKKQDSHTLSEH